MRCLFPHGGTSCSCGALTTQSSPVRSGPSCFTVAPNVPEFPAEPPLLPGSLLLPKVAELQSDGDEQLEERRSSEESVAVSDGAVASSQPRRMQLCIHNIHIHNCNNTISSHTILPVSCCKVFQSSAVTQSLMRVKKSLFH